MGAHTQLTGRRVQSILGVVLVLTLVVASSAYAQQTAGQLLQSGLYQEEVKGDLDEAIKVFERILEDFATDRPAAAKALLHIGLCYEKLGKQEAQKAYQRLIKEYADQPEPVQIARRHLQQLDAGAPGAKANGPTYRLVLDSQLAGMSMETGKGSRCVDFSPSGDRIVFPSEGKLNIANKTGTVVRPLLDDFAPGEWFYWPRWSPDGRQIAFMAARGLNSDSPEIGLFVVSPDGGSPRRIIPSGRVGTRCLRWTSDGKHLTYVDLDGVHTLALDGSEVRLVPGKDLPAHSYFCVDAEYSPNGRWLAYCGAKTLAGVKGGVFDIWIQPAAGGEAQALGHSPESPGHLSWAPDGRTLYFVSGVLEGVGTANLWKVAIDPETGLQRGEPRQVTFFNDTVIKFPKVLRDGDQIAFEMKRSSTCIFVANGSPPYEPRAVARCSRYVPQVSPDGETIYYVADDGIFAVSREGGTPRRLTETVPALSHDYLPAFNLSGDGQTLAYTAKLDEAEGLFTLPVSGGEPQLLVKITVKKGPVPQWSPDGSQLAYAEGNDLYVIPAAGGQPSKIAHVEDTGSKWTGWDGWTVRWSPDGKFIAAIGHSAPRSNAVFVAPASGGELRQLTPDSPDYLEGLEWHPDGQRLSYNVDRRASETRLAYLDGRPPTVLVDHPDGWDYIGAWAPDGRRFFFQCIVESAYGIYVYDEASGDITLFSEIGGDQVPPRWSRDGKTAAWYGTRSTGPQAWIMENF